jgi:hypothetical protein
VTAHGAKGQRVSKFETLLNSMSFGVTPGMDGIRVELACEVLEGGSKLRHSKAG